MTSKFTDHGCLPLELITEILLRCPVKSLGRFKSVCKSWNFLISTHNFAKSHFQISASRSNPLSLTSLLLISLGAEFLFSLDLNHLNDYRLDAIIEAGLIQPLNLGYSIRASTIYPPLGSCHGLICIQETIRTIPKPMCVLNPTTKEFKYIPFPNGHHETAGLRASGLGFVPSFNDYRIVLLKQTFDSSNNVDSNRVDVFSLRDDQWKRLDSSVSNLDASLDGSLLDDKRSPAAWLDEALYWVIWTFPVGSPRGFFVLEFDLAKETFLRATSIKEIGDAENKNIYYDRHASVGVIAQKYVCVGQLYAVQSGERFLEMWMMEKYGELNKLFRLRLESEIVGRNPGLLGITPNGSVWLMRYTPKKQEIFLLDPSRNPPTYVLVAQKYIHRIMSYIPSLVTPSCVRRSVIE